MTTVLHDEGFRNSLRSDIIEAIVGITTPTFTIKDDGV